MSVCDQFFRLNLLTSLKFTFPSDWLPVLTSWCRSCITRPWANNTRLSRSLSSKWPTPSKSPMSSLDRWLIRLAILHISLSSTIYVTMWQDYICDHVKDYIHIILSPCPIFDAINHLASPCRSSDVNSRSMTLHWRSMTLLFKGNDVIMEGQCRHHGRSMTLPLKVNDATVEGHWQYTESQRRYHRR